MCQQGHLSFCDSTPSVGSLPTSSVSGAPIHQLVGLGGFATHTVVPEWAAVSVDKDIPFPQKSLVGCAVTTGVGVVLNTANVNQGTTVAVFGYGGVGLNCIQGADIAGAHTITVWVGAPPVGLEVTLDSRALVFEKSIIGSYYGIARPHIDFARLLNLYKSGKLKLDELISRIYTLEDVNVAFDAIAGGDVARSVISFD